MDRDGVTGLIRQSGIIAIIRGTPMEDLPDLVRSLKSSCVRAIEVAMNSSQALDMVGWLAQHAGSDVAVGAGTVLDSETARSVMLVGASFVVSPSLNARTIEVCHRYGTLVIPGVLTPTEVISSWELGAGLVKVFPAGRLGPDYVRDLRGLFPQVEMVAVGGVTLANAADFMRAGCAALGVGSELVDRRLVTEKRFDLIAERAAALVSAIHF